VRPGGADDGEGADRLELHGDVIRLLGGGAEDVAEGATVLACPLNLSLFGMTLKDLVDGVKPADPAKYYKEVVIPADMNLTF